jgi:arabinan endo-1,5-alpha-L-arabinosidase
MYRSNLTLHLLIRSLLLALLASSGACSQANGVLQEPTYPAPAETAPATAVITLDVTPTAAPAVEGGLALPVLDRDFPDPDLLKVSDAWYAYATNSGGRNIQVARSEDLFEWVVLGDALPALPAWAVPDFGWAWAPEVSPAQDGDGYLMYYTARFQIGQGGTQCIGVAASLDPQGPFQPQGNQPLVCQTGLGGSIDPAVFDHHDGQRYLLWKNDGNSGGGQSWLYIQPLAPDGLSLQGEPARLLTADLSWEGILVEAPTLWHHEDRYYLFYSANLYNDQRYATGYAVADGISGPYIKAPQPLLKTDLKSGLVGPGGQDVVMGPGGETWIAFHGWRPGGYRAMYLGQLEWSGGSPVAVLFEGQLVP